MKAGGIPRRPIFWDDSSVANHPHPLDYPVAPQALKRRQLPLLGLAHLDDAIAELESSGAEDRGAIFTRREVVDFILDLVGYTPDKHLANTRLLEPAFGAGDFLLPAVERLVASAKREKKRAYDLRNSIRAVEIHQKSFERTGALLRTLLIDLGFAVDEAQSLCKAWLIRGDFLLTELDQTFTHVVGNPPYIRQELIPQALIEEYRRRYVTIYDRADIYIPFIERSLTSLSPNGILGFICADRWTKNKYGQLLRQLIVDQYHLHAYIDMFDTDAFASNVIAYPAIFVIGRESAGTTRVSRKPKIDRKYLTELAQDISANSPKTAHVSTVKLATSANEPWLLDSSGSLEIVKRLEASFPTLEEAGCKVGIGVATGADGAFIGPLDSLDVEPDRKLPLIMTKDINSGSIKWQGYGVIDPFEKNGALVDLAHYPKLKKYLESRRHQIAGRHVAKKAPRNWYRTIDRIYPDLVAEKKLLIPDIKGEANIVYDEGRYYPHHNLYYVTSREWDVLALQSLLKSGIAKLFVSTYSTKMRGGYLRYQAQYLRRIRIPHWKDVPAPIRTALIAASRRDGIKERDDAVAKLYGLSGTERRLISQIGIAV